MKKIIIFLAILAIFAYGCETPIQTQTTEIEDTGQCAGLQDTERRDCQEGILLQNAVQSLDETPCSSIETPFVRQVCRDNVIMNKAIQESNIALCQDLNEKESIPRCEDNYHLNQAIRDGSQNSCNKIQNQETKDNCLAQF